MVWGGVGKGGHQRELRILNRRVTEKESSGEYYNIQITKLIY